jgi:hypothetical protein
MRYAVSGFDGTKQIVKILTLTVNKDQLTLSAHFLTLLHPNVLFTRAVQFSVDLKACRWLNGIGVIKYIPVIPLVFNTL